MAIRNDEVKKILYALRYLKDIRENYNEDKETYKKELLLKYPHFLNSELHNRFINIGLLRIKDLIDQFEDELQETYLIIPKENKISTPESSRVLIKRIIHNSPIVKEEELINREATYKFEEQVHDDYTITTGILQGEETFDVGIIRPTCNSHIIENNTFDIPINLNLPIEEITAFIEKIKYDSQENQELIKSPLELLGEELETIEEENVEKHLPKKFDAKLNTMINALFAYDTFLYLKNKQQQIQIKRDKLQNELDKELSIYNQSGRKTTRQKINIKKITKKYEPLIQECDKKINHIEKTVEDKHTKIGKTIGVGVTTIERYLKFMDSYIGDLKYKRLFIKTKK